MVARHKSGRLALHESKPVVATEAVGKADHMVDIRTSGAR